ncbi:MAG: ferrochelatase [Sphingomonadaceae bacterium]|nr:ferrochelatase [Sphingomonadaceae bacterium]
MTDKPDFHPDIAPPRVGVLLVNLGTPDAPTPQAVRAYLAEFLSDRRVIEIPPALWQPILHGVVLRTRPRKSAAAYRQIWTEAGSPLAVIIRAQAEAMQAALGEAIIVRHAMRYGRPGIGVTLDAMIAAGCDRILIAPLYPQYCGATTASVADKVEGELATLRWRPAIRMLPPYHDDPAYIGALAASVEASLGALDFAPQALVASFHGMPRRTLELGDPYHCQCQKTARLLGEALGRPIFTAFQSRFGRAKWLEPATDDLLRALPQRDIRRIAVVAPGFSADCLETLEELAIRGRESFLAAGGEAFAYLPCLNDSAIGLDMLETLVRRELGGWI